MSNLEQAPAPDEMLKVILRNHWHAPNKQFFYKDEDGGPVLIPRSVASARQTS